MFREARLNDALLGVGCAGAGHRRPQLLALWGGAEAGARQLQLLDSPQQRRYGRQSK